MAVLLTPNLFEQRSLAPPTSEVHIASAPNDRASHSSEYVSTVCEFPSGLETGIISIASNS